MTDIDFEAVFQLSEPIETPGYVVVDEEKVLFVPGTINLMGMDSYVGYQLDGADGELGRPVFIHRKMKIRQLGTIEKYLQDSFVQACLSSVTPHFLPEQGALPLISVIEGLRVDPGLDIEAMSKAVLERRALLLAESRLE